MVEEPIITLPIENFLSKANLPDNFDSNKNIMTRDQITSVILAEKDNIQKTFINDEYLELDTTNHEIIGLKSKSAFWEDRDALLMKKSQDPRYRNAKTEGLCNASILFNHI